MSLPMHNRHARPTGAASRDGGTTSRQPQRPHGNYEYGAAALKSRKTNLHGSSAVASGSGKEGIVQRLQRALVDVRRDRDREHRLCEIAREKLRAAKEAFREQKSNLDQDQEKLAQTRTESTKTQEEILLLEARIEILQQKVNLVHKREKIQHQNAALTAASQRRDRSILAVRQRLDHQRDKYQKLERTNGREANLLLEAIASDARKHHHQGIPAAPDRDATNGSVTTTSPSKITGTQEKNTIAEREANGKESERSKNGSLDLGIGFDQHRETLEKKNEETLAREFKTMEDYAVLPKMILQKAKTFEMEAETLRAEVTRLEEVLAARLGSSANANYSHPHYPQEKKQRCDTDATVGGGTIDTDTLFAGTVAGDDVVMAMEMANTEDGIIQRNGDSRAILERNTGTTESNPDNTAVEETNETTVIETESLQPDSNHNTLATRDAFEQSNPAGEGWNAGNSHDGMILEYQGAMEVELNSGSKQRDGNYKEGRDGFTATNLEPGMSMLGETDDGRKQSLNPTLAKATSHAVVGHDVGSENEGKERTTKLYSTPLEHKNDNREAAHREDFQNAAVDTTTPIVAQCLLREEEQPNTLNHKDGYRNGRSIHEFDEAPETNHNASIVPPSLLPLENKRFRGIK
eukprot:jgi/Psemu1/19099/gm1.19099_g